VNRSGVLILALALGVARAGLSAQETPSPTPTEAPSPQPTEAPPPEPTPAPEPTSAPQPPEAAPASAGSGSPTYFNPAIAVIGNFLGVAG